MAPGPQVTAAESPALQGAEGNPLGHVLTVTRAHPLSSFTPLTPVPILWLETSPGFRAGGGVLRILQGQLQQHLIACPRTGHFSKEPLFLLLENGIRNEALNARYAHYRVLAASWPLS